MRDGKHRQQPRDLNTLLCPATLKKVTLRSSKESVAPPLPSQPAQGEIGDLFASVQKPELPSPQAPSASESSRWELSLDILVEEFLTRKSELSRLNKARRDQIEEFLRSRGSTSTSLEQIAYSRPGSQEYQALQLFGLQVCVFQLLQILLVKRWADRGLLPSESLRPSSSHTLNWQITSFLKRNIPKGMIGRHDWSFTKQNIFSWYSPAREVQEKIRALMEPANLSKETSDFPARLLRTLGAKSRLQLLGFSPPLIDSRSLWRLLLEQKASDLRMGSAFELDIASESSGAVLVSGLAHGDSLNSLRELTPRRELHGVWAFADSEFERFLSEIFLLWDCETEVPRINLHPRSVLRELVRDRSTPLFHAGLKAPYQAEFAACFQDARSTELEDAVAFLEQLRENGLLLVASDHFWPTDSSERCERLRENALKQSAIRMIIDLRQLTCDAGESLPKGVAILEKCSSKELRDSNRPQLLRARGHIKGEQMSAFWAAILEQVRHEANPGEVNVRPLAAVGEGVRLEVMAAAASQQQLRSSPWVSLSDPAFYDASGRLRRSPSKAYSIGAILRWKPGMPQRGIFLQEFEKHLHAAIPSAEAAAGTEASRYLFLPESSMVEDPVFFVAQIFSAPVQFWYRLELEQGSGKGGAKNLERQYEQRLKLMPLIRLFEPGALLPVGRSSRPFGSIEELRKELSAIFRQPALGSSERVKLHELILSLENSINQNLKVCAEYAQHVYPNLPVHRWELPGNLPEVTPAVALGLFSYLDRCPIMHHPSIHVTKLRNIHDFKVTNCTQEDMPLGTMAELKIFHGVDAALKLSGPSLLIRAAKDEIQKRIGRPWREISDRILFPTDFMLVQSQLRDVVSSIDQQLAATREQIALMDQIFCCLFGLTTSFTDDSIRQAIRRHLSPEESRVNVRFAKEIALVKSPELESPTAFLQ